MTTVPVLWVSHDPEILHRGYADQGLLEAIFDRRIWCPPAALRFDHREVRGDFPDDIDGAIVVLPSRHHVDHVDWFCEQLDRLSWSVVLLTSEEEWVFDWRKVWDPRNPRDDRRLWVWQPRPEHEDVPGKMPCGFYRDTLEAAELHLDEIRRKPWEWFFGGQVTHVRRKECAEILHSLPHEPAQILETEGYFQGIPFADYIGRVAAGRVVPCPSGPESCCTARVEETLETGGVPIVDLVKPKDPQFDYWRLTFGPDCPLQGVADWARFPAALEESLAEWPASANRVGAWWTQWKRRQSHRLDEDVRAVSGLEPEVRSPDDLITVVIPTSPVPANPEADHIAATIASIRSQLPLAEVLVAADAPRPELEHRRQEYEEYLRRVIFMAQREWHNVAVLRLEEWGHQANVARAALELVETPLVLFVEHDTPLVGPIDWVGICGLLCSGQAQTVRFHFDVAIHPDHEAGMIDRHTRWEQGVPVRRTRTWWQRPHVSTARFYRERVLPHFTPDSRTMIEDLMHGVVASEFDVAGEAAWWDWRLWVYAPEDDPILGLKRSAHLDARGTDPKFGMKYE